MGKNAFRTLVDICNYWAGCLCGACVYSLVEASGKAVPRWEVLFALAVPTIVIVFLMEIHRDRST